MGRAGGETGDLVEIVGEEGTLLGGQIDLIQRDVVVPGEIRPGWEKAAFEGIQV